MHKIKTLTVGIPAHNEEVNIGNLLRDLSVQEYNTCILEKIIILSDGSTDGTVEEIQKIQSNLIKLIDSKERKGLAYAQNEIIKHAKSDILVMLHADIRIPDRLFIEKLIKPVAENNIDLSACDVTENKPKTVFEKILYISTKIKNVAYRQYRDGLNVYTCRGLARAFSKRLYKKIYFKDSIGEDAYSYFYTTLNGYKYDFINNAKVIFRLPNSFSDHKKQSMRFFKSQQILKLEFGEEVISKGYYLPKAMLIKSLLSNFISSPFDVLSYIGVLTYLKANSLIKLNIRDNWEISTSSKNI